MLSARCMDLLWETDRPKVREQLLGSEQTSVHLYATYHVRKGAFKCGHCLGTGRVQIRPPLARSYSRSPRGERGRGVQVERPPSPSFDVWGPRVNPIGGRPWVSPQAPSPREREPPPRRSFTSAPPVDMGDPYPTLVAMRNRGIPPGPVPPGEGTNVRCMVCQVEVVRVFPEERTSWMAYQCQCFPLQPKLGPGERYPPVTTSGSAEAEEPGDVSLTLPRPERICEGCQRFFTECDCAHTQML